MRDKRGFSLIELIVVIAIIAVLSTMAISGLTSLSKWNVNKCASALDGGLDKAKVTALSKSDASFKITKSGSEYHMIITSGGDTTEEENIVIAKSPVTISYVTTGNETKEISETETLTLKFDRSSGAFKPIGQDSSDKDIYCSGIQITRGTSVKTIELYYTTGKHKVQ